MSYNQPMEFKKIIFTQAHFEYICEETLNGRSIVNISKTKDMPKAQVIYSWIKRYECLKVAIGNCRELRTQLENDQYINKKLHSLKFQINFQ